MTRWLIYAVFFTGGANLAEVIADEAHATALARVLELLRPAAYAVFGASAAAGLTNQKALLLVVLAATVLIASPTSMENFGAYLIPVGAGILVGSGVRQVLAENGESGIIPQFPRYHQRPEKPKDEASKPDA